MRFKALIKYTSQNIFDSEAEVLVNPVNCVGVMGAGLAKQFKDKYPVMFKDYQKFCKDGKLKPGLGYFWDEPGGVKIFNISTKNHWRDPSKLEWVDSGLGLLATLIDLSSIKSVSIPMLGCGLGGLDWGDVKPLIEKHFSRFESCEILVHEFM